MASPAGKASNSRYIAHGLLLLLLLLLQFTPGLTPRFFGQPAELPLCLVLIAALFEHGAGGAAMGFAAGLVSDVSSASITGFNAGVFMVLGAVAGYMAEQYLTNNLLISVVVCSAGVFAYKLLYFLCFYAFRGNGRPIYFFFRYSFVSFVFTVLLSVPLYWIVRMYRKQFRKDY